MSNLTQPTWPKSDSKTLRLTRGAGKYYKKKKRKKKGKIKIHPTISNLTVIFALLTRFIVSQVHAFVQRRLREIVLIAIADR